VKASGRAPWRQVAVQACIQAQRCERRAFVLTRACSLDAGLIAANALPANIAANQTKRSISVTFDGNAFIVADFAPSVVTPAIAYNLDPSGAGVMRNVQVIGTAAFFGWRSG
jgi:hypothetical protein